MNNCFNCTRPLTGVALACPACTTVLAEALYGAAGHAEDAEAVITGQTRYGFSNPGASHEAPLPGDLTALSRLTFLSATITRWAAVTARHLGRAPVWQFAVGPLCPGTGYRCEHQSCEAIRRRIGPPALAVRAAWLARHAGALARIEQAPAAFTELHRACAQLAHLVDRPPGKALVGMCDCGKVLYAKPGAMVVVCSLPTCRLQWDVERSQAILRTALDDKLVTAAEAARLAQYLDTDRTQDQIRKLINQWATRNQLIPHTLTDGEAGFRFGEVSLRLARTPRRRMVRVARRAA